MHCHCVESSLTMICGEEGEKDRRRRRRRRRTERPKGFRHTYRITRGAKDEQAHSVGGKS